MHVICYVQSLDRVFDDTWEIMKNMSPELGFELHRTIESFEDSLRQPVRSIAVVMLYLSDTRKLSDILTLRSVLVDLPLIILLNDQEPEILQFSHDLRPRVILYTHFGIKEICSVLERFLNRYKKQHQTYWNTLINQKALSIGGDIKSCRR